MSYSVKPYCLAKTLWISSNINPDCYHSIEKLFIAPAFYLFSILKESLSSINLTFTVSWKAFTFLINTSLSLVYIK